MKMSLLKGTSDRLHFLYVKQVEKSAVKGQAEVAGKGLQESFKQF